MTREHLKRVAKQAREDQRAVDIRAMIRPLTSIDHQRRDEACYREERALDQLDAIDAVEAAARQLGWRPKDGD
jgi:hypothetical protein